MTPKLPTLKLFFDGGCRPNPGPMETAVVVRGVVHHRTDIGVGASHEAEWRALLHALEIARASGAVDIVLLGDAADVVAQANGRHRCSPNARVFREQYVEEVAGFARVRLRHVRRGQNLAGVALERRAFVAR